MKRPHLNILEGLVLAYWFHFNMKKYTEFNTLVVHDHTPKEAFDKIF